MTSSEDGDLIDLGNESCVPRVPIQESSPEEQEHLLDVCPPKLEETLSLTRKQEQVQCISDNGDVLVTLGHDQVVPIRKRIDFVSSDTIKRVRDITRNLEPVIRKTCSDINEEHQDTVDYGSASNHKDGHYSGEKHEDETFEAQEINNAFNFLAEHDDNNEDDQAEANCNRCDQVMDTHGLILLTCSTTDDKDSLEYHHNDSLQVLNCWKPSDNYFARKKDAVSLKGDEPDLHDPAFELCPSKPSESISRKIRSVSADYELEAGSKGIVKRTGKRGSSQHMHRKSWTEGTTPKNVTPDTFSRFDRSTSLREYNCQPSTSNGVHRQSSFISRYGNSVTSFKLSIFYHINDPLLLTRNQRSKLATFRRDNSLNNITQLRRKEPIYFVILSNLAVSTEILFHSVALHCSTEEVLVTNVEDEEKDGCSECSEVDWSWLEEVECPRGTESLAPGVVDAAQENTEHRGGSASPTSENARRRRGREHRATEAGCSAVMSVSGTVKSLVVGSSRWSASDPLSDRNVNDHQDDTVRCNASNEAIDRETRDNGTVLNSWVRASMRRLRHLRLPEGTDDRQRNTDSNNRRGAIVSAPNSLPDIALIAPEILAAQTNGTSGTLLRPSSAPVRNANSSNVAVPSRRGGRQFRGSRSQGTRTHEISSRQSSVLSTVTTASDTTTSGATTCSSSFGGASTSPPSSTAASPQRITSRRICERQRDVDRDEDRGEDEDEDANPLGKWPHALSPALACLSCTLGLFNISRFSILSVQFGANFIVQFLILSLVLGIPLLTLHVCLGQRLAAGSVDMWKISPLFQGVGIALLIAQAFIGIYSIVGVSWMFVYFRDSFITKQDKYRWAEPFSLYRDDKPVQNNSNVHKLYETVPDYFSGVVLQRHHLNESDPGVVTLKFQVAFNLAVVWMIVFVSLSKGLRSYGKVVYVFTLVPVFGTLVLCTKLLGLTPPGSLHQLFPATVWTEFFINGKSWVAASIEVFLTWGLLGAAAMQIAAHNKHKHLLQRDTSLVIVLTIVVLLLAAFLANTCVQVLKHHGYIYIPSSFERISSYVFMRPMNQPAPPGYSSTPERFMAHASFIVGERVTRPGADFSVESGYQALRFSTELVPATLALLGTEQVSPFWAVLFYFILILFGIAQQLAIWHCVITGIMAINAKMMKLWETTITFFSCACAYILGLPMATEIHSVVRRSVPCYFCNEFLDEKYLFDHVKQCGSVLEECPFKCGVYVLRKHMEQHRKTCNRDVTSRHSRMKDMQDSLWRNKVFSALTLLRSVIHNEEKERKNLRDNMTQCLKLVHSQRESIGTLHFQITETIEQCRQYNATVNQRLHNLEVTCDNMEQRTSSSFRQISEQLKLVHSELTNERNKHDKVLGNWCLELKDLKTFVTQESEHVNKMWQEQRQLIHDLKLELEMRCKNSKELIEQQEQIIEKVNSLEGEVLRQSATTSSQKSIIRGLKFQVKENLKYLEELISDNSKSNVSELLDCRCREGCIDQYPTNGRLLWRIDRYKEKMTEAKESDCALYSPIFSNKEYGYTLRLELFLNGIGQWKDRHIIGCLRVENGKWDPLLDWPCVLKAAVTLRNQENPANDIKKLVKAIGRNKSNGPVENKEPGIYMFIPHTTLTRYSGYIKDNVLFLDIQLGIHVVYYLDYTIGGTWWIMILYLVQVGAVFAVRGRPHSGEAVVAELFPPTGRCLRHWAGPLLSFTWNVILPVILMVLSITVFKNADFRELYSYRRTTREYWPIWARQLGAAVQLIPILTIPAVAIIQTCRYLNNGPPDIFDRIQLLYRPSLEPDDPRDAQTHIGNDTSTSIHGNGIVSATTEVPFEDPPPKYTPPPSYTTATGARIAKMLRQSFRRSVRRIANVLGESSAPRQRPALQPPPPDYATVLVEMNQGRQMQDVTIHVTEVRNENTNSSNARNNATERHRPNTIDRTTRIGAVACSIERTHSTLDRPRRACTTSSSSSNLTAVDVANLLRSSIRRGTTRTQQTLRRSFCHDEPTAAASVENLVEAAAPIGEESLVLPKDVSLVSNEQDNDNSNDKKTAEETENSVSVI
ncbi:Sodium-dependent proline transporter [Habropoda laboriosa]|uniref:Sodium-dependent proline transporter n=1 Tax=Habropoda laboriosa TaxID=597456 RepID=A0A0L7RB37_9HYME|nr:Sodium-dependent proline transporter [Habropoda laboriosa]